MDNQEPKTEVPITYITRESLIRYMVLFALAVIVIAAGISIFFGSITAGLVSHFAPSATLQSQGVKVVNEQSALIDAVKKSNPAVVSIIISKEVANIPQQYNPLDPFGFFSQNQNNSNSNGGTTKQEVGGGSGFIIKSDNSGTLILTNKHVASDTSSSYTVILTNGQKYDASIVATDPTNDIALVSINAKNLPTLTLSSSSNLQLGQSVIAIGNALGQYQNTVSVGVVSGINRGVTASDPSGVGNETLNNVIQTDASINPGNSGGPLLDINGNVIGINTAVAQDAQGIGFAIPIDQAKSDVASVEKNGKIVKPELGVRTEAIDNNYLAQNPNSPYTYGALITPGDSGESPIVSGSPAEKAGLQNGDIILMVDGTKVNTDNTLPELIQKHNIGDTVTLHIARNGKEMDVKVTLDKSF